MSEPYSEFDAALDALIDPSIGSVSLEEFKRLSEDDPFVSLLTQRTVESFAELGLLHELLTGHLPVYREVLDEPTFPCQLYRPALEEIEAIEEPERRADAIVRLQVRATDERTRNLILSVKDTCWLGDIAQGNILPLEPVRKVYPWWWKPRQPYRPDPFAPNLFELFKECEDEE